MRFGLDAIGRTLVGVTLFGTALVASAGTANADTLPAGNYQITTVTAGAFFFNSNPPYDNASLFVTDTITQAQASSTRATSNVIEVNASWSGPNGFGNGCSILANAGDFTFASDLSSATLHTTFTQQLAPCNSFEPLVPDVTVDATWAGSSPTTSGPTITRFACGGYQSEGLTTSTQSPSDAQFSFEGVAGPYEDTAANLNDSDQSVHAQGALPDACFGPSGKGFGIGPQAPGRYLVSLTDAGFNSDDIGLNAFVQSSTFAANPNGPASARSGETDLFVDYNGSFGCFVIPASDVTFAAGVSGATVHAPLDQNTTQCEFGFFPYLPLTIDMSLTATGPVATTQGESPIGCFASSFTDRAVHAGGAATLTFSDNSIITDPAGSTSSISRSDRIFRLSGSTPCTA